MLRGQTSDVATHLHRSSNFNEARELYVDLEEVVEKILSFYEALDVKSFNCGENSFFFFLSFFFLYFLIYKLVSTEVEISSREEDVIESLLKFSY